MAAKPCKNDYAVYRLSEPAPGLNRRVWNQGDGDAAPHGPVDGIFTGPTDPETGFPAHPNPPTIQDVSTAASVTNADFPSDGSDQIEVWGYIVLDEPALLRDINVNNGEFGEIWIGQCCGQPVRGPGWNDASTGPTATDRTLLDPTPLTGPGIHYVYGRLSDLSAFAGFQLQTSVDGGGSWQAAETLSAKPEVECLIVPGCDPIPAGWSLHYPALCAPVIGPDIDIGVAGPAPATTLPIADNEVDTAIRTGQVGTSLDYSPADHNHPIRRQAMAPDPVITVGGTLVLLQADVLDRWSTEEEIAYAHRVQVSQPVGNDWGYIRVPAIAGYQQPQILALGSYRTPSTAIQVDGPQGNGGDGAGPRGPFMASEFGHWSSTRLLYSAYIRRDNPLTSTYVEFITRWIRL